jgi:hypothetical protein
MRRSDEARWFLKVALMGLALSACNNPPAPTDANHMGTDGGGGDSGPVLPTLPAAMASSGAAMVSCVGTATQPTAGANVAITLDLIAFGQHGDRAPNTRVCFCPDNVIDDAALTMTGGCGACQDVMTDGSGHASVMARANGWYGYRVFGHHGATPGTTFLDSIQINEQAPASAGGTVQGNAVTVLTENLILAAELLELVPGTTTIAGRIDDCGGNEVSNAIVRAFHADGSEIIAGEETTSQRFQYFDGAENPDASGTYTNTDGLYVVVNVPTTSGERIRVEAWGYTGTGTGTPTRIGCEAVEAFPDGVSIVNIGPTRNDYPVGHPCHS